MRPQDQGSPDGKNRVRNTNGVNKLSSYLKSKYTAFVKALKTVNQQGNSAMHGCVYHAEDTVPYMLII